MSFNQNKQNLIDDTKALIEIGVDRTSLLKSIENGAMDETIKESGDCMSTAELGDLCNGLASLLC